MERGDPSRRSDRRPAPAGKQLRLGPLGGDLLQQLAVFDDDDLALHRGDAFVAVVPALEVEVAQQVLQSLGLRAFAPQVTSCPGCGRTTSTFFQTLADRIQSYLRAQMPDWRGRHPGVETMNVAVMGCVVNGPGESKHANIGISLPGSGENPVAPVFVDGVKTVTLKGDHISE